MRAGPLRDQIEVLEQRNTRDAGGGTTVTWEPVATVAGRVDPLTSRERMINAQSQGRTTARVTLRYFPGLSVRHKLAKVETDSRRTFDILGVINPDERRVEHVCDVVEVT
ncbi:MAG: phage head closure protein [Kofleriaceae bacterium]|jgi:SPP1 family predicted phage head-tail adaptor|nr:phage head closure protein [Kofleriaceae bacterium]